MDTDFTRKNASGDRGKMRRLAITPDQMCDGPAGFDPKSYATSPMENHGRHSDGDRLDLGGRKPEARTPGHTPVQLPHRSR
jgi:hypothetical protein